MELRQRPQGVLIIKSVIATPLSCTEITSDGKKICLPHYMKCKVDGKEINTEEYLDKEDRRIFEYKIKLPKWEGGGVQFYFGFDDIRSINDTKVCVTSSCVKDLTIIVVNRLGEKVNLKYVELNHPKFNELSHPQDNLWAFKGGLLPGQGFAVSWESKEQIKLATKEDELKVDKTSSASIM